MIKNYPSKKENCKDFTAICSVSFFDSKKEQDKNIFTIWMLTFMIALTLLFGSKANAQVANYVFSESAGTYTALAAPTTAHATGWDDAVTGNTIPINFTFNFNGTNYTTCSINTNGYITFGATLSSNVGYLPISVATGYSGAISALGVDLVDGNTKVISYKTTGAAPNRVFTVQWNQTDRIARGGHFDFQIQLNETSNVINIIYGTCAPNGNSGQNINVQVGLRGASNADFNNRSLTADNTLWENNTTAGGVNTSACRTRSTNYPSTGTTFTWTPKPTITGLAGSPACAGGNITITGTNLIGATPANVKVNGTAVSSITSNNGTTIVAVIGVSTTGTGTVTVTTAGGTATSVATFTITAPPTITLTSAVGTNNQTKCINTLITPITYSLVGGGVTGATVSGLPAGVVGAYAAGVFTITGTPTALGIFNYTVTSTGATCPSSAVGTITVSDVPTATLSSAAGTNSQTVCQSSVITNITYTIGGSATSATASGLPAGVTGAYAAGIFTISGTPSVSGPFSYTVTSSGGPCTAATAIGSITVNGLPANPGNPTSNSPQCNPPGVTLTRVGAPPAGETWYWQTVSLGTSTANSGNTYVATTTGTYYIRSQNNISGCWSIGQGSLAITINSITAISTNPANSSIAPGANTSFTTVATNTPTSYTWQVSTDGGGTWTTVTNGGVYSNATTATLNITAAPIGMNGYQYHVSATNACGTSAYSTAATLTVSLVYCTPVYSVSCNGSTITNVTLNTINNNSGCGNPNGTSFTDYSIAGVPTTSLLIGSSYNLTITTGANTRASVWIDYDQNGSFDTTEYTQIYTNAATGTISITIPVTALSGVTKMRIRSRATAGTITSTDPCTSFGSGETEDYRITLSNPAPCVAPTTQPSALILATPAGGTTINGTFTAAAPVPNNYLVVISTSPLPPTPINGTTYTIGGTVETGGYLVVDTDNNTSFSATGLSPGTQYYIYIFSYNSLCTGGPLYNTTSPLNGTATTTTVVAGAYCTPSTTNTASSLYIKDVAFLGTLQDVSNYNNSYSAVTPGYQDFTALAPKSRQAQGEGVNIYIGGANASTANRGHWKAWVDWNKDGLFNDPGEKVYDTGGTGTSTATFGFVIPATTAPGDYRIRIRLYNLYKISNGTEGAYSYDFNSCEVFDIDGSGNYREFGEAEDYLFTVEASCPAIIKTVTPGSTCGTGTVVLAATGSSGTTSYHWYAALTGGAALATTATGSWTTPSLSSTTTYYVTADNGSCESKVRTAITATVNPIPTLSFTPTAPQVCGENTIISLTASGDIESVHLINENFEAGTLGSFTNVNIINNGATTNAKTAWQNRTSTFVPAESVWFPAISSGFGKNKFAMSTSDLSASVTEALTSATVNTNTFLNLNLTFNIYYSSYLDGTDPTNDYVNIDVNDGSGWTTVATYTTDLGIGTKFDSKSIALNAYINKPALQIRILYHGIFVDGAAVDNIDLYGDRPLNTAFNWTGGSLPDAYSDAACTIPYVSGTPAVTVWIKPTLTQLEQGTYTFTASAVLNNGCSASTPITVTNNTKVWKGTTNNDWNTASNWLPAVIPDATTCVIIPSGGISRIINTPDALAKNVTVKAPTGNLELQAGKNLTVTDFINVEAGATFNVRNNANLVQINSVANTGNITMQRIANLKLNDYAYWSTAVGNGTFPVTNVSPATPSGYIFKWDPVGANANGGQGNWINGNENMVLGKGYIVRGANGFNNATTTALTASFVGVPNNGTYNVTIQRGSDLNAGTPGPNGVMRTIKDDNWNLIGNPYPSSIKALDFLAANLNIDGNVRIWTHNTLPSGAAGNPFYGSYSLNYTPNDYIVHNGTGTTSGPAGFSGFIAAGQSFLVLMNDGAAGSSTVTFNNTMRNATYNNNQFYKTSSAPQVDDNVEKDRIWLDFLDQSSAVTRTLVGYIGNATDDKDRLYDAITDYKNTTNFYSVLNNEIMTIQGKSLPFHDDDTIKLGFKASANGSNFKIGIAAVDGIFSDASQNIYLEDKLLNVIFDLKSSPYTFSSNAGIYNDRFVLRYTNQTLSNNTFDYDNSVKIFASNRINVKSANQTIKEVSVFDILGKTIFNKKDVNAFELSINELSPKSNVLIVKVILDNNIEVIKKVVF